MRENARRADTLFCISAAGLSLGVFQEGAMEKVTGIGGLFFRARDPDALAAWYRDHLGVDPVPGDYAGKPWRQEAGPTAFAPFPRDTKYLGDLDKSWMINFR